jgi:hypothetical protein
LPQAGDEGRRTFAEQVAAAPAEQRLPAQLQQLAGVVVGGQHFAVQAQGQQPLPGTGQVLRAAVESQHQVLGVAQPEQAAFDVAGGEHQRGEAVLGLGHDPFAGHVEHADHFAIRARSGTEVQENGLRRSR